MLYYENKVSLLLGMFKTCPLPFYKKMRPHGPDEKPPEDKVVEIRFSYGTSRETRTGWDTGRTNMPWMVHGGYSLRDDEIVSWKYLEVK